MVVSTITVKGDMPLPIKKLDVDLWRKKASRCLLIGGPNKRKTWAMCNTWYEPIHCLSYPGEKGTATIPIREGVQGYVYEEDEVKLAGTNLDQTIKEVETMTWEILMGKHGPINTFAGDGLHKLAACYWRREYGRLLASVSHMSDDERVAKRLTDEDLKIRSYGNENYGATKDILQYISKVSQSGVPHVVFSCWEGREVDDPDAQRKTSHIFAELPGKLARLIVGEFSVVLYCEVSLPDPQGNCRATWQIRPKGKIWGVGIKGPVEIISKLPDEVPQDWQKLYPQLIGEVPVTVKK